MNSCLPPGLLRARWFVQFFWFTASIFDRHEAAIALGPNAQEHGVTFDFLAHLDGFFSVFDRLAIDFENDVAGAQAFLVSVAVGIDVGNEHALDVVWNSKLP